MSASVLGGSSPVIRSLPSVHRMESRREVTEMSCQTQALRTAWAEFILSHYRGATEKQIARAFGVSDRTVRYWLNQEISPRGEALWTAVQRDGFTIPRLRREPCKRSANSTGAR